MRNKTYLKKTMVTTFAMMAGCVMLSTPSVLASSAKFTTSTKNTSKIAIDEVDYDLKDKYEAIEIDFKSDIRLKSSSAVSVKDNSGNTYKTSIHEYDSDDLSLDVTGLKTGKTYTVTIKGIKKASASKYGTLTIKFSIPKSSNIKVKDVDFDEDDREVTFDFNKDVTYKNAKVVITNTSGSKTYTTKIVEKDEDELTVRVKGLKEGSSYKYKITGVQGVNASSSKTISGSFTAVDND